MLVVSSSKNATTNPGGDITLAGGAHMSMRLWRAEEPHDKPSHRSPYESLGFVLSGRAELVVEGQTAKLEPGDSYLVPANAEHTYRILETFTAVECNSPAQARPKDLAD